MKPAPMSNQAGEGGSGVTKYYITLIITNNNEEGGGLQGITNLIMRRGVTRYYVTLIITKNNEEGELQGITVT